MMRLRLMVLGVIIACAAAYHLAEPGHMLDWSLGVIVGCALGLGISAISHMET
jgi:hypothetical protein